MAFVWRWIVSASLALVVLAGAPGLAAVPPYTQEDLGDYDKVRGLVYHFSSQQFEDWVKDRGEAVLSLAELDQSNSVCQKANPLLLGYDHFLRDSDIVAYTACMREHPRLNLCDLDEEHVQKAIWYLEEFAADVDLTPPAREAAAKLWSACGMHVQLRLEPLTEPLLSANCRQMDSVLIGQIARQRYLWRGYQGVHTSVRGVGASGDTVCGVQLAAEVFHSVICERRRSQPEAQKAAVPYITSGNAEVDKWMCPWR